MKVCQKFERFDEAASPLVQAIAVGGDGIQTIEQVGERKLERCTLYKDKGIPKEMRFTEYDVFVQNQWSESVMSWGPNGTLLPHGNNTYTYKSLIDSEGLGIICIDDRIWASNYWYARATKEDYSTILIEFWLRPREINKTDLLLQLMKRNCCRPCDEPETMFELPCKSACKENCGLRDTLTVKDDEDVELPTGKVKGKAYKDTHMDRVDYNGCLEVCISGDGGGQTGPFVVKIDPTQNTVKLSKEQASTIDFDWKTTAQVYDVLSKKYFAEVEKLKANYPNINSQALDTEIATMYRMDTLISKFLKKFENETVDNSSTINKEILLEATDNFLAHLDFPFLNDPIQKNCVSKNPRNLDISSRVPNNPIRALSFPLYEILFVISMGRISDYVSRDNVGNQNETRWFPPNSNLQDYTYCPGYISQLIPALFMQNTSPFGDQEYGEFCSRLQSYASWATAWRKRSTCKFFSLQDGDHSKEGEMGPSPPEEDGCDGTETGDTSQEDELSPASPSAPPMDTDEEEGPPATQTKN